MYGPYLWVVKGYIFKVCQKNGDVHIKNFLVDLLAP
jgi:hypothetical protein